MPHVTASTAPRNSTTTQHSSRNPWPIAIVVYFAIFVTFIAAFITFASRQREDLVRNDYYEQEIRYQDQIDRVTRTQLAHAEPRVAYDATAESIRVTLPSSQVDADSSGTAQLYRPSNSDLDRQITLGVPNHGEWKIDAHNLQPGLWKIRLHWTINGSEYYHDQAIVLEGAAH